MSIAAEKLVTVALNARSAGRLAQLRPFVRGLFQEDSDRARTGREALLAFSVRVLSAAILYLSQIVLARWMGSVQYGIYVFVWTWVLVLGGLSNLGLSTVMIRLVPAYRATNQLDLLRGLLRYGRLMAFAAATATALLGLAGLSLFGSMMSDAYMIPLYLGLVCVPMITLTDLHDGIGRGNGWIAVALVPPYVLRPLMVLWAMLAAHAFGWTMSAATATGAAIVATWATAALQSILVSRRLAAQLPPGPATRPADFWLRTSLPLLVISGSELLLQTTDVLVISSYLAPEHVAVYFASAKTMALVMFIHYAVGSAMAKRFAALSAKGDHEALRKVARDAVNWTFWPSLAAAVGLLALGKPLLWLFGPQFVDGYPIMSPRSSTSRS